MTLPGNFTGSITVAAETPTPATRRTMTAAQLATLDSTQGCVVSVVFTGECDPHGLGRALGAILRAAINQIAANAGAREDEVAKVVVPVVLHSMVGHAGLSETLSSGAIQ